MMEGRIHVRSRMSETCKQLLIGIIVICVLFMIVGGFLASRIAGEGLQFVLGVLLGGIIAMVLAGHMDHSIQSALDRDEDGATKFTRKMSAIRFLIMAVTLVVALSFPKVFHIIGVLLGILALKFSAYAQPLTSKYISTKNK